MSTKGIFPIDEWDLKSSSVLTVLPKEELEVLTAHLSEEECCKGQLIFKEGACPAGIYFIREGKVKISKTDKEGREQIIYIANKGELIGYHALLAEEAYPDTASALEHSSIAFIPKTDFWEVLNSSKVFAHQLLKTLSHEFYVFVNSIALFAQRSVRERFAVQLVLMREKYKQNFLPGMEVEINMSRDDWANLVGTARENIVRILKDFKEEGILETRGRKIIVRNFSRLLAQTHL